MATICYSCFHDKTGDGPCPHCGYDPEQDQEKYAHALPHGTVLAGAYITGRVLGQGGFGITYAAQEYKTKELVAIKEFFPDTMARRGSGSSVIPYSGQRGEDFAYGKTTFLEEAKTLAEFQKNPNVVHIYNYFEENGTAYFTMEYVEGINLQRYVEEHGGKIGWEEAKALLLPVLDALIAVHAKGLIHRDIKPENIMIMPDETAKLLDFGSARYSLGEKSQSLDVVLTYGFSPWEQYSRHGKQGPYTDVYALAATLYYAVTGLVPPDSIDRVEKDTLVPLHNLGLGISAQQEDALSEGLSVRPENRLQTIEALRTALYDGQKTVLSAHKRKKYLRTGIRIAHVFAVVTLVLIGVFFICLFIFAYLTSRVITVTDKPYDDGTYSGTWRNNKPYGYGTILYANGNYYEGEWEYGNIYGNGTMTYSNGSYYDGEWAFGQKEGTGTMIYENGDVYIGEWNYDNMYGTGTMTYANGDIYEGEWDWSEKEGIGTMIYANGDAYEGKWSLDKKSGTGKLICANGDWYDGEWTSDEFVSGSISITYEDGSHYEGGWSYSDRSGTGTMTYANGDVYEGEWRSGDKNGTGTMTYANGDVYEGEWYLDKREGTGSITYASGGGYEGEWKWDCKHGRGTTFFSGGSTDGMSYTGNWYFDNALTDDTGIITMADGTQRRAVWADGSMQFGDVINPA